MLHSLDSPLLETYLPTITVRSQAIYCTVLLAVLAAGAALPFVMVDVAVRASGLVRPVAERSDVKATATGTVAALFVKENQSVRAGQPLLRLHSEVLDTKRRLLTQQQTDKQQYIQDLTTLT